MGMLRDKRAVLKFSFLSLGIILLAGIVIFSGGVLANTHASTITITPNIVPASSGIEFTAHVECTSTGSSPDDAIHEVRIYEHFDFKNIQCDPADGWYGPFPGENQYGEFCLWTAKAGHELDVGDSEDFTFSADTPDSECCRTWLMETRDKNNYWIFNYPDICIDTTDPETTYEFTGPQHNVGEVWWIDGITTINLFATDEIGPHDAGIDKTWYLNVIDLTEDSCWAPSKYCSKVDIPTPYEVNAGCVDSGQEYCFEEEEYDYYTEDWYGCVENYAHTECQVDPLWKLYRGEPIEKGEESCHIFEYFSVDGIGNIEDPSVGCFFVDTTHPVISKEVGENKVEGDLETFDWWVTQTTPITLNCEDVGPHPSNDVTLYWRWRLDSGNWNEGSYNGESYDLYFDDSDSVHDLEFWCEDAVEKESETDYETFKVDSTPPKITKTMIGEDHLGDCPPLEEGDECYVADNGENGVSISVYDPDPTDQGCAVGDVMCRYWVLWGEGFSIDDCVKEGYDYYGEYAGTTWCLVEGGSNGLFSSEEGKNVIFNEDSRHLLIINCWDALENQVSDVEEFLVDSTPPETTKTYGFPHYPEDINVPGPYPHYINSTTPITLTAEDEKVGTDKTYWGYIIVPDQYCYTEYSGCQNYEGIVDLFSEYNGEIILPEESCHLIEFYSVDKLGNIEETKRQCVFVDNNPPTSYKEIGSPNINIEDDLYISQETPIYLTCTDEGDHPVDHTSLWYRYRVSEDCINWGDWMTEGCEGEVVNGWCDPTFMLPQEVKTIYFPQDSCHELEYFCVDALGNTEPIQSEIDIVDSQTPEIVKEIIGPQEGDCPPEPGTDDICYIDGETYIEVTATDPQPHPVDNVLCTWWYTVDDGQRIMGGENLQSPFIIQFPEESKHDLWIRCWDALGNGEDCEDWDHEVFYVDKTPPEIWKDYVGPFEVFQFNDYWAKWMNFETEIHAGVNDIGPHLSGIKEVKYRVTLADDEDCKYPYLLDGEGIYDFECDEEDTIGWTDVDPLNFNEFIFGIDEESCHMIEIMATDNVDKCSLHKQFIYVDNTPPEPNKTVGEVKMIWDGSDSVFYPDETQYCWSNDENMIECWKVTMDTPIHLDCIDPEPHPVDHEITCFMVGLDGEDYTEQYCDHELEDNGYCCGEDAPYDFYFEEESEHNLKYYCEDALGNVGPVDEEKFKVFGKMFEIQLNKKWNLISVPFDPIDCSTESVFKEVEENIESVWSYDSEEGKWHVYRPDQDLTNDLDKIKTGDGYWVMALEDDYLVVGGSLFKPGPNTPPSKELIEGWNLIGYYGTDGEEGYYGPEGNGKNAYCALYSLRNLNGLPGTTNWNSLWSYWEPQNPNQWDIPDEDGFQRCDEMDPGAGYWIAMDTQDTYNPQSVCSEDIIDFMCDIF